VDEPTTLTFRLKQAEPGEAGSHLRELSQVLDNVGTVSRAALMEEGRGSAWSGQVIQLVAAGAMAAVARALVAWLKRRPMVTLSVTRSDGTTLEISGANSRHLAEFLVMAQNVQISGSGNIVVGDKVLGVEPVEPWPQPGKPRK
jgi:hypothetical protein